MRADPSSTCRRTSRWSPGRRSGLLADLIAGPADMATLATPFRTAADFQNPTRSRSSATGERPRALLLPVADPLCPRSRAGRSTTPGCGSNPCYKHLGLYAYKAALLEQFARLPQGRLEQIEKLEQLRVLENGSQIAVGLTEDPTIGVDTPGGRGEVRALA